jgi:hypothetical protein
MAADLAGLPTSGLHAQPCGDAHLSNFGLFGSPELIAIGYDDTTTAVQAMEEVERSRPTR